MKPVMLIIGAIMVILLLGATLTAIQSFRGGDYTDTFNVTTTNETSVSKVLSQSLLDDVTANAVISSNCTDDAPVPSSYTSATKALVIAGLETSTQRILTVAYKYPQLDTYWGADLGARAWPLFLVLGVIGIIAGAVYSATRRE